MAVLFVVLLCVLGCGKEEPATPAAGGAPAPGAEPRRPTPTVVVTGTGIEMVGLQGDTFVMGGEDGQDDEKPAREVHLQPFFMDRYEVTQQAFEDLMGRNPAKSKGPAKPVEQASWLAAARYCNARSLKDGFKPCYDPDTLDCDFSADGYRLPTEAEWEYACRAGTAGDYSFAGGERDLPEHGWFKENSGGETHPVGQLRPNGWGLYDMHGNVAEWCQDFYDEAYYAEGENTDPVGPADGEERVLRGGAWNNTADACRSSARYSEAPGFADVCFGYDAYGFRCVRRPAETP